MQFKPRPVPLNKSIYYKLPYKFSALTAFATEAADKVVSCVLSSAVHALCIHAAKGKPYTGYREVPGNAYYID